MITMLKSMKMKKNEIPEDILPIFEHIVQVYEGSECDIQFGEAMEKHLTKEQRFRLYEQNGACRGTGDDVKRKTFANEHAHIPLAERLELFEKVFGRNKAVLNNDNTITVKFACTHGHYREARLAKGKYQLPKNIQSYFERCAGGRMYEYQKALGIKLRIKSVDVSPLKKDALNPVVFTFEIVE